MKKSVSIILCMILSSAVFSIDEAELPADSDMETEPALSALPPGLDVIESARSGALRWKLKVGDVVEIRKKSTQVIKITDENKSGKFLDTSHIQREVLHRVVLNTMGVDREKGYLVDASFSSQVNYKENPYGLYQEEDSQESSFFIQPLGTFLVDPGRYMPNVRDIPVFPAEKDPNYPGNILKDGDTWAFPGFEIMQVDGLEKIPLNVSYEYRGTERVKKDGVEKIYHKILYNIEFNHKFKKTLKPDNPRQMFGFVTAKLIWDEYEGIPYFMTEDYDLVIMYNNGVNHEFKILSKSNYTKKRRLDDLARENIRKDLENKLGEIKELKLSVKTTKKGISVQIPDILFSTNSSSLTPDHARLLERIGKIMKQFTKDRQVLVRGHTDNTGSGNYNDELSKRRAESVAKYLVDNAEIPLESLSFEGVGSKDPAYDNATALGRKRNRRVEIILLDH